MKEVTYTVDGNTILEYYLAEEKFHDKYINEKTVESIHEFSIESIKRVSDKVINIKGHLLILVTTNNDAKTLKTKISIPVLYDETDQFGNKNQLDSVFFEDELNDFKDGYEQVDSYLKVVIGKEAEHFWNNYLTFKKNVLPDDTQKYPDLPKSLRMDLELTLGKYTSNKSFKERYDNFLKRFYLLSSDLVKEYPNDVKLVNYKGMPIIYLLDENAFQLGSGVRLYMTPISLYSGSISGYTSKVYDLSKESILDSKIRFHKISPDYVLCPNRLQDLSYILNNLDSRSNLEPKKEVHKEEKKFFGLNVSKLFKQ